MTFDANPPDFTLKAVSAGSLGSLYFLLTGNGFSLPGGKQSRFFVTL